MLQFEKLLLSHGCKIVGKYVNTMTKIDIQCRCGKIFSKRPNDCLKSKKNQCESCRFGTSLSDIEQLFQNNHIRYRIICLDNSGRKFFLFKCQECKKFIKKSKNVLCGKNKQKNIFLCHACASKKGSKSRLNNTEIVINFLKKDGSDLLSRYEHAKHKLKIKCRCGNIFERQWNSIYYYNSTLCLSCANKESNFEKDVKNILDQYNIKYVSNINNLISPHEIDIYIPEHNIAIECNGVYWHSETMGKQRNYHLNKTIECNKHNVQLIHIFDLIWHQKQHIYYGILSSLLHKNTKIHARKCQLSLIDKNQEKEFLQQYHLQGYITSNKCFGLIYNDELVMVASFGTPRFDKKYDLELLRCCSKIGYTINGGFSKLMSIINNKSIVTYVDRCISNGKAYIKSNFDLLGTTQPSYYYFKNKQIFNRLKFQKHKLSKLLPIYNKDLTEWQNMVVNGYDRFWDCGNLKFVKH